jgi:hypothetical protein
MSAFPEVALKFALALKSLDYTAAHAMLCETQQQSVSVAQLKQNYETMVPHNDDAVDVVQVMETLTKWPDKKPDDLGWAYVAMSGKTFSEAVAVVVKGEAGRACISAIEWGRP